MKDLLRRALAVPAVPDPPGPRGRDWLLVAAVVVVAVVETALRDDVVWWPLSLAVACGLAVTLPWRRTHPLATVVIAFGTAVTLGVVQLIANVESIGLYAMAIVLLLPYSLFRWASGRQTAIGGAVIALAVVVGMIADWTGVGDAIGGIAVVTASVAVGLEVRTLAGRRVQEVERVRLRERERLARELHDTVAHHVSAIVVQAQAGRTLAPTAPEAAVDALEAIERAATEALDDMRAMVRILRDGSAPDLAPQGGVGDLTRLAARSAEQPRIEVELDGRFDDLPPPVDAALYRMAQESITNALRHAREAESVVVRVEEATDGSVRLTVHDDGAATSPPPAGAGFGLIGMAERAPTPQAVGPCEPCSPGWSGRRPEWTG